MPTRQLLERLHNERGLSITELLVAVVLSSIAAGILFLNSIFFNTTTIQWQKNLAAEMDVERIVTAVDHELRNLTAVDTLWRHRLDYRNRHGRKRSLILSADTLAVPGVNGAVSGRIRLDSAFFAAGSDLNNDGLLYGSELNSVDFIACNMNFSFGRDHEKRFAVEIRDRLLNRPPAMKEF